MFSNLSMDTLDYTGPGGERGVEGRVARPRRSGARAAAPVQRARPSRRASPTCACSAAGVWWSGAPSYAEEAGAAARLARDPAFCRLAARRADRRAGTRRAQRHELPVDDVHALRAGRRHSRRRPAHRPQPDRLQGPIVIDARLKPGFPKELVARADTAALVTSRWKEYFPGGGVEMGDSDRGSSGLMSGRGRKPRSVRLQADL